MTLCTTTIGAYPKPSYVPVPDWFQDGNTAATNSIDAYNRYLQNRPDNTEILLDRATQEVVQEQVHLGIDFPTDGEIRRENYIHYHCRHLDGIDFSVLTEKVMRSGAWINVVPTITGRIRPREHFLPADWKIAQAATDRPVKMTLPGPVTMSDSLVDMCYGDDKELCQALADALNVEILALAEAGCRRIQVDEPVFARKPEKALAYGIECLERCFHGVPREVTRVTHICCGYPATVDDEQYFKASPEAYFRLAGPLDEAEIDAVSLEDAHRPNDLTLLEQFARTTVILGVIAIARSRVESAEEVQSRLQQALEHIDADRLIAAPDCGLGMLDHETVTAKLRNMVQAAKGGG
ncbi:5-methyltetrahydropteroyltriglutamate--homocysteine methyltransferase [candidate division KSB3 bacterium]|uniref:5-methyltetrahydropteroyltriglutamate--homocysteine methyltransferase n=1 Tax=candidate division KSB3 bacterium TaxID=2044937 RepID=A0A9D5JUB7_9BACT|nr:5-methyltetrahydropteroyltriglutamate--homocysteine methyltransferase [candidate division KSB3 bacterium]MBD3324259.1 5-methyltetrahydropteroyltriglutamate--homocysteine methyltransferase [candidate division KSB3 bacterium]